MRVETIELETDSGAAASTAWGAGTVPACAGRHPLVPTSAGSKTLGYGLVATPIIGTMIPLTIGTGTESSIVAALIIADMLLGIWVIQLLATRQVLLVRTPLNLPVAAVALIWIVACVASNAFFDPRVAARLGVAFTYVQMAALTLTLTSLGVMLLATNIGADHRYASAATWALIVMGSIAMTAHVARVPSWLWFMDTRGLFSNWVVALAYGQALFNQQLSRRVRVFLLLLTAAFLYKTVIQETGWLSGWMPPLAAVGIITLLRSRALSAFGAVAAALVALRYEQRIYDAVIQSQLDEGSDSRLQIWAQAWELLSQYPLLGTGPAGYAAYYFVLFRDSAASLSTHSNYIDIAAETGIIGLLAFLWLLAAMGLAVWRACRRWRDGFAGGFAAGVAGGFIGAVVAMGLGDWVIPFVYNQGIDGFRYTVHTWIYVGLAAGLTQPLLTSSRS